MGVVGQIVVTLLVVLATSTAIVTLIEYFIEKNKKL
tara:strand:+ start:46588 stop:46695 length:108 start_codon:yes stop_codon:yes gene_type:complete